MRGGVFVVFCLWLKNSDVQKTKGAHWVLTTKRPGGRGGPYFFFFFFYIPVPRYSQKRLGSLLALGVRGVLWTRCAPTEASKGAKGRMGLMGAVDKPKDRAVTLLSLKFSSAESAFSPNKWESSKGKSISLAWTSQKGQRSRAERGNVVPPRRQ